MPPMAAFYANSLFTSPDKPRSPPVHPQPPAPAVDRILCRKQYIRNFRRERLVSDREGAALTAVLDHLRNIGLSFRHARIVSGQRQVIILPVLRRSFLGIQIIHILYTGCQFRVRQVLVKLCHLGKCRHASCAVGEREPAEVIYIQLVLQNVAVIPLSLHIHGRRTGSGRHDRIVGVCCQETIREISLLAVFLILREGLDNRLIVPALLEGIHLIVQFHTCICFNKLLQQSHNMPSIKTCCGNRNDAVLFQGRAGSVELIQCRGHCDIILLEDILPVVDTKHIVTCGITAELTAQSTEIQCTCIERIRPLVLFCISRQIIGASVVHVILSQTATPVKPHMR